MHMSHMSILIYVELKTIEMHTHLIEGSLRSPMKVWREYNMGVKHASCQQNLI